MLKLRGTVVAASARRRNQRSATAVTPMRWRHSSRRGRRAEAGMHFLLTWNCKHIANANVLRVIARTCRERGYELPVICTPEELTGNRYVG